MKEEEMSAYNDLNMYNLNVYWNTYACFLLQYLISALNSFSNRFGGESETGKHILYKNHECIIFKEDKYTMEVATELDRFI